MLPDQQTNMPSLLYDNRENGEASFDDWSVNLEGSSSHNAGGALGVETEETTGPLGEGDEGMTENLTLIDNIPPHLHPAVSLGMRRVSSCYFSVRSEGSNSVADLLSLLDEQEHSSKGDKKGANEVESSGDPSHFKDSWSSSSSELLYHDILMNVFTYLDAPSLSAVSETTRKLNFEVFYFLELQLQRALIPGGSPDNNLSSIAGVSIIRRLTNLNRADAQSLVQEFLDSNASLRQMPLSHSLAYMRQVFQNNTKFHPSPSQQALASAALLVTLLGAASSFQMPDISPEIPNMIFRLMGAASLMKAAKSMTETPPEMLRERAEQMKQQAANMAERLQEASHQFFLPSSSNSDKVSEVHFPSWSELMRMAYSAAHGEEMAGQSSKGGEIERGAGFLLSHNPYAHIPKDPSAEPAKTPTGCIGAYLRTVKKATRAIAEKVRESRRQRFLQFSPEERNALARRFLQACTSNDSLEQVKAIVFNGVDVDGFYVGADGTETCALHTAAFNGADQVVRSQTLSPSTSTFCFPLTLSSFCGNPKIDFLCGGVDDENGSNDGGLCNVNCRDANAWTALHFAAGSNSVEAARCLVKHGADFNVEANNGYSAHAWAVRLKHHEVAQELKELASQKHLQNHGWMAHRPLSAIASRFFAFVMVQSH